MSVNLFKLNYIYASLVSVVLLLIFLLPAIITKNSKGIAANFNLLTTMLLGGFWHGASWNFIIWGAIHGVGLGIHKIWMLLTGKTFASFNNSIVYRVVMGIFTFHFVCFGWIFFRAENYDHFIPDDWAEKAVVKIKTVPLGVYIIVFFGFLILYGYFKSAEQVLPIYLQF